MWNKSLLENEVNDTQRNCSSWFMPNLIMMATSELRICSSLGPVFLFLDSFDSLPSLCGVLDDVLQSCNSMIQYHPDSFCSCCERFLLYVICEHVICEYVAFLLVKLGNAFEK